MTVALGLAVACGEQGADGGGEAHSAQPPKAAAPSSAPEAAAQAASQRSVPGSRVSLWLPSRAERVDRSFRFRFERAGGVEVRVAETTLGPPSSVDLDAQLAQWAGVPSGLTLVEDPPGSGWWRGPLEAPSQVRVRQLRSGSAAAAVMVGLDARGDLDVAERILESATLDPRAPLDLARMLGIAVDEPVGTVLDSPHGRLLSFQSTNSAIDGGLSIGWVPATVELDDAFLESVLREMLHEKIGVVATTIEPVEHGGLRGFAIRGETPTVGRYYIATMVVPGETEGLFLVHASASGPGSEALQRVLVSAARTLRVLDGDDG